MQNSKMNIFHIALSRCLINSVKKMKIEMKKFQRTLCANVFIKANLLQSTKKFVHASGKGMVSQHDVSDKGKIK